MNFPDPEIECLFEEVYKPSDDTYLIIDYLKKNINESYFDGIDVKKIKYILDMGTGTGIIALFLNEIKKRIVNFSPTIFASDILENALKCAKLNEMKNNFEKSINFIHSNLFKNFPERLLNCFNIIIFNPPYLPSLNEYEFTFGKNDQSISWDGGKRGTELFLEFVFQVQPFINSNKECYIYYISSSVSKFENISNEIAKSGFRNKVLKKKHVFFEDIILNRLELI
ncbi:MAG: methyltransferase [Candidatus Hermodarchaeota archaeon]